MAASPLVGTKTTTCERENARKRNAKSTQPTRHVTRRRRRRRSDDAKNDEQTDEQKVYVGVYKHKHDLQ
jgi:hypothetical protein